MGVKPEPGRLEHLTTEQLAALLGVAEDGQVECPVHPWPPEPRMPAVSMLPPAGLLVLLALTVTGVLSPAIAVPGILLLLFLLFGWLARATARQSDWPAPDALQVEIVRADPAGLSLRVDGDWHRFGWEMLRGVRRVQDLWRLQVSLYVFWLDEATGGPVIRAGQAVMRRPWRSLRRPTDGVPDAALSLARMDDGDAEAERGLSVSEGEQG